MTVRKKVSRRREPEETVEGVLIVLVCAEDIMVRHNDISLVSRLPELNALLAVYRLGRQQHVVGFLVNLLVILANNWALVLSISHLDKDNDNNLDQDEEYTSISSASVSHSELHSSGSLKFVFDDTAVL